MCIFHIRDAIGNGKSKKWNKTGTKEQYNASCSWSENVCKNLLPSKA